MDVTKFSEQLVVERLDKIKRYLKFCAEQAGFDLIERIDAQFKPLLNLCLEKK